MRLGARCVAGLLAASWLVSSVAAAPPSQIGLELVGGVRASPLDTVTVVGASSGTVVLTDGAGREYARAAAQPRLTLRVGARSGRTR